MSRQSVLNPDASFFSIGIGIERYYDQNGSTNSSGLFHSTKIRARNLLGLLTIIEGIEQGLGLFKLILVSAIFKVPVLTTLAKQLSEQLLQGEYSSTFFSGQGVMEDSTIKSNTLRSFFFDNKTLNLSDWDQALEQSSGSEFSLCYTANKITIIKLLLDLELRNINQCMQAFSNFCQFFLEQEKIQFGEGFFESVAEQLKNGDFTFKSLDMLMTLATYPAGSGVELDSYA